MPLKMKESAPLHFKRNGEDPDPQATSNTPGSWSQSNKQHTF